MQTVSRWGNSLALRIPATFAETIGLTEGVEVELKLSGGRLIVEPVRHKYDLKQLLAKITPNNRHDETDWGQPVGKEPW